MGRTPQHADVVKLRLERGARERSGLMGAFRVSRRSRILEVGGLVGRHASDALEAATRRKNQEMVTR
jgi:hypothetical protein